MGVRSDTGSVRLTDSRVKALKPGAGVLRVFDSEVRGFHVRIQPSGAKSYAVTFQRPDGSKVHVTIGSTDTHGVDDAREQARALRQVHDKGGDARAFMLAERTGKDVAALVKIWEECYRHKLKASTQRSHNSIIKCTILPALGSRLVKDLDYSSIQTLYRREQKEHPTGANRMIEVLSRLMNIAEKHGLRDPQTNPCFRFEKDKPSPRQRVLNAAELGLLESTVAKLIEAEKLDQIAADMVRFMAFSGLRVGEACRLKWADIDLDRNSMTFGDHKTDGTMGKKVLPLNSPLRSILSRRAGQRIGKLVFPGIAEDERKEPKPIQGLTKMMNRVNKEGGKRLGEIQPKDLRSTFNSVSVELGYPPAIGDVLLGHSLGKIRDAYTRLSMEGILAKASEDTAQWIAAAMRGEAPKPGSKVAVESQPAETVRRA